MSYFVWLGYDVPALAPGSHGEGVFEDLIDEALVDVNDDMPVGVSVGSFVIGV